MNATNIIYFILDYPLQFITMRSQIVTKFKTVLKTLEDLFSKKIRDTGKKHERSF